MVAPPKDKLIFLSLNELRNSKKANDAFFIFKINFIIFKDYYQVNYAFRFWNTYYFNLLWRMHAKL